MKRVAAVAVAAPAVTQQLQAQHQQKNTIITAPLAKQSFVNHNAKSRRAMSQVVITAACLICVGVLFVESRWAMLLWHQRIYNDNGPLASTLLRRIMLSTSLAGCVATADVLGNLGPPSAVLVDANDNTDWLKHRWQAASDMHGTAIRGPHWLQLTCPAATPVELHSMDLDWEAAFANQYKIQILRPYPSNNRSSNNNNSSNGNNDWTTVLEAPNDIRHTVTSGISPGVKQTPNQPVVPLHVVHTLNDFPFDPPPSKTTTSTTTTTTALRILMDHPGAHPAWGVSLWQVKVYGRFTTPAPG